MCIEDFGHRFPDAMRIGLTRKQRLRLQDLTFNFPGIGTDEAVEVIEGDPWGEERIG